MPRQEKEFRLSRSGSTLSGGCFRLNLSRRQIEKFGHIGNKKVLKEGDQLVSVGSRSNSVFILEQGNAGILKPDTRGTLQTVRTAEAGEMLGLTESLAGAECDFCICSVTDCVFTEIPREEFVGFLHRDPDLCFELASLMATAFIECLRAAT